MRIEGFIWLEEIVEKIARKHNVQVHEAEQVFQNLPKFRFVEKGYQEGSCFAGNGSRHDLG